MWRACILVFAIACGGQTEPAKPTPGSAPPPPKAGSAYAGPPQSGPCNDAHDCTLRNVCGCSCEAVVLSAPKGVACDETCSQTSACTGHTFICDLAQHRCGAIPPPHTGK